jgi:hypothetical protein
MKLLCYALMLLTMGAVGPGQRHYRPRACVADLAEGRDKRASTR